MLYVLLENGVPIHSTFDKDICSTMKEDMERYWKDFIELNKAYNRIYIVKRYTEID